MNLLEMLTNEIYGKNLTEFEIIRYIYLRCCELFSFDARISYTKVFNDNVLNAKIKYKRFNINNIDTNLVICHSMSKSIMNKLIEEFTNADVEIKHDICHTYLGVPKYNMELDAISNDLARVKFGLKPISFLCEKDDKVLSEIDEKLGYQFIDDKDVICNSFEDVNATLSVCENVFYADAVYYITRFLKVVKGKYYTSKVNIDPGYIFHKFYFIGNKCYVLEKIDEKYGVREINKEEFNEYNRVRKCI